MNRFGFIDSSGILAKDPFLGTGLLVIRNVGDVSDKLCKNAQPAKEIVHRNKKAQIDNLIRLGRQDEAVKILMNPSRFEMKFDNVRASSLPFYEKMIDIFFSDAENRFSATVVRRSAQGTSSNTAMNDTWETYTDYAADLVVKEMNVLPEDAFCIVLDEISKPRKKPLSLEDTLLTKVRSEIAKDTTVNPENLFGAFSIESHSNFLMQLSDLLLGAVVYDYKKDAGFATDNMSARKEVLVNRIRTILGVKTLASSFSKSTPAFFSVIEMTI